MYLLFQYKLGCVITESFNRCEDSLYSSYISVQYALSDEYFSEYFVVDWVNVFNITSIWPDLLSTFEERSFFGTQFYNRRNEYSNESGKLKLLISFNIMFMLT